MDDSPKIVNKILKRVNEELWCRYGKDVVPGARMSPDKREQDKAMVVHRLDLALAEVQSTISTVKTHNSSGPLGAHQRQAE